MKNIIIPKAYYHIHILVGIPFYFSTAQFTVSQKQSSIENISKAYESKIW